jgi:hypothetical protein
MKVVINTCFGGFGLSDEAFEKFLERKGIAFEKVVSTERISLFGTTYFEAGHAGDNDHSLWQHQFCENQNRSDPDLIAVIEEMGESANSWASELTIVEVPDDAKWHIHEYDGMEHVAEDHRIWG